MKVSFILIGKTTEEYLRQGMSVYEKRLVNYIQVAIKIIPDIKNTGAMSFEQQKTAEGKLIMNAINPGDIVILLDENGKSYSSVEFSVLLQKHMLQSTKNLTFIIGGPYGFSDEVYTRADDKLSLSKMTFSHQMVRLIFLEQLYRGFSILKNEPYHH